MSKPMSSSATMLPGVDERRDRARLRHGRDVERAALGADLELLLEVAGRTRSRRCSRRPTLIMSSKIFWYAATSSGSPALRRFTSPVFSFWPLPPPPVATAVVVVVVAAARAQCECHRDDGNDQCS